MKKGVIFLIALLAIVSVCAFGHTEESAKLEHKRLFIFTGAHEFTSAKVSAPEFDLTHLTMVRKEIDNGDRKTGQESGGTGESCSVLNRNDGPVDGEGGLTDGDCSEDVGAGEVAGSENGSDSELCNTSGYLGVWTVTAYCSCPICCGEYSSGYTASGTLATAGRTIASNNLPFGTQVEIDGVVYTVEDTGYSPYGENWIDIYFDSHEDALAYGVHEKEVYLVG